jgi:hypothetical protein
MHDQIAQILQGIINRVVSVPAICLIQLLSQLKQPVATVLKLSTVPVVFQA